VGVLINDLGNPWFVDLLAGLATVLHSSGFSPILADGQTLRQDVDGLLVVGITLEEAAVIAAATEVPVVLAGTMEPALAKGDIVVNDDVAGAASAAGHLIELGHTSIAHLRGPGEIGRLRLEGFQATLAAAGLDGERYIDAGMSEEGGNAAARRLLTRRDPPTAIFAHNDMAAIGVLSAADDLGLTIPGEVSLVGYDNTFIARIRHVSLTSVDTGNFAVGTQAGRFLVDALPILNCRTGSTSSRARSGSGNPPRRPPEPSRVCQNLRLL
jgi:DNA-binding LacI/PurR family transcriptional regulator